MSSHPARRTFRDRLCAQTWLAAAVAGVLVVGIIASVLVTLFVTLGAPSALGTKLRALGVVLVAFVGFLAWQSARWRRACRRAEAAGGRLCPCCLYPLDGPPSEGHLTGTRRMRCPECGLCWGSDDVAAHWARTR